MLLRLCWVLMVIALAAPAARAQRTSVNSNTKAVTAATLTEQDNGTDIDLKSGDELIVRLPDNPSTGFNWTVVGEPVPLKLQKSSFHHKTSNGKALGSSGISVFQFMTTSRGIANLTLVYRRSWEYNVPPLKTFSVRVNVR